jgi:hypothetical protein
MCHAAVLLDAYIDLADACIDPNKHETDEHIGTGNNHS